jgi:UDP-N-acetylmuramyl pentapeptide phosphotransferase/UDP-N-acetylglucosamine-1-phosphate transferase
MELDALSWRALAEMGLPVVFAAMAMTAALIVLLFPLLRRYALARPNARSAHKIPTPQGGGIAVIASTLVVLIAAATWICDGAIAFDRHRHMAAVLAAMAGLAALGIVDDIRPIAAGPRLVLQALAVGLVAATLPDDLRIVPALPLLAERAALTFGLLWFVNLVNFMDGIDWMSVVEVVPVTAGLAILAALGALPPLGGFAALALGGAMLGFAPFNRPVARLFLGDVGSLPIGLLLGWLLVLLAGRGHLAAALLLPLYYLADATITLVRRLAKGERVWEAHRTHFYQRALAHGFAVVQVTGRVFVINIALAALAILTVVEPGFVLAAGAFAAGGGLVAATLVRWSRPRRAAASSTEAI